MGYVNTTGIKEMDYIIGDPYCTPKIDTKNYTEKILQMPDIWSCLSTSDIKNIPTASTPALKNGYITFGCFNNPNKINENLYHMVVRSYFVEFWVRPVDLFRPCPDKEITDGKCDLCFPEGTDPEHIKWINENRISRYYQCDLYYQYPWGQLGYTYDWNPKNKSHFGLSEFIIGANKTIYINRIVTTLEYLK